MSEKEFLRSVETVFERLRKYNVTLNPKWFTLAEPQLVLGNEIDAE